MTTLLVRPTPRDRIKNHQRGDQSIEFIKVMIEVGKWKDFTIIDDKVLYHQGWLCLLDFEMLKREMLEELTLLHI